MGTLKDSPYYDKIYATSAKYNQHYTKSHYYGMWLKVINLLGEEPEILEIGCGPGQFAAMLYDLKFRDYFGIDFSSEAVKRARVATVARMKFTQGDAREKDLLDLIGFDYDTVIAMEVFEHTDDMKILANLQPGSTIILTVPDFDDPSHVRHFKTIDEVKLRYVPKIEIHHLEKHSRWYILKGKIK